VIVHSVFYMAANRGQLTESDLRLKAVRGEGQVWGLLSEAIPGLSPLKDHLGRYARWTGSDRTLKMAANAGSEK